MIIDIIAGYTTIIIELLIYELKSKSEIQLFSNSKIISYVCKGSEKLKKPTDFYHVQQRR